jgi:hypothetical protein
LLEGLYTPSISYLSRWLLQLLHIHTFDGRTSHEWQVISFFPVNHCMVCDASHVSSSANMLFSIVPGTSLYQNTNFPGYYTLNAPAGKGPYCWGNLSCGAYADGTAPPLVQVDDSWWYNAQLAPHNCVGGSETQCPIAAPVNSPQPHSWY